MDEYISKRALLADVKTERDHLRLSGMEVEKIGRLIDRQPAVEMKPVVHAHWKPSPDKRRKHLHICSSCEGSGYEAWAICPNCGAVMDEKPADEGQV